jgi:hypothetical protein
VRALLLLIVLSGCGGGSTDEPENHGYGWQFDAVSSGGLRLRKTNATEDDANEYERLSKWSENCVGADAPPPFVIVVPKGSLLPSATGRYFSNPPLIVIDESVSTSYGHELVHYLLDQSTGDPDISHASALFLKCTFNIEACWMQNTCRLVPF